MAFRTSTPRAEPLPELRHGRPRAVPVAVQPRPDLVLPRTNLNQYCTTPELQWTNPQEQEAPRRQTMIFRPLRERVRYLPRHLHCISCGHLVSMRQQLDRLAMIDLLKFLAHPVVPKVRPYQCKKYQSLGKDCLRARSRSPRHFSACRYDLSVMSRRDTPPLSQGLHSKREHTRAALPCPRRQRLRPTTLLYVHRHLLARIPLSRHL